MFRKNNDIRLRFKPATLLKMLATTFNYSKLNALYLNVLYFI